MRTQRQESKESRHRASPTILYAYAAVPALLLGAFLVRGVLHDFRGNWSALFYFGDARLEGLHSKVRLLSHRSFGFHSATPLIALIYLCCSDLTITLPR